MKRYREGDWIGIPLGDGGYGVGLVARRIANGGFLGYFFGPRRTTLPTVEDLQEYQPADAIVVGRCGETSLRRGEWPLLGPSPAWDRNRWPVPIFGRVIDLPGLVPAGWRVHYPDGDLSQTPYDTRVSVQEASALPSDATYGAGYMEVWLTRKLGLPSQTTPTNSEAPRRGEGAPMVDHFLSFATQDGANKAVRQLTESGYTTRLETNENTHRWSVVASCSTPIDGDLSEQEGQISRVARAARGSYEGYERDVSMR